VSSDCHAVLDVSICYHGPKARSQNRLGIGDKCELLSRHAKKRRRAAAQHSTISTHERSTYSCENSSGGSAPFPLDACLAERSVDVSVGYK
jgi:hypothetical protein